MNPASFMLMITMSQPLQPEPVRIAALSYTSTEQLVSTVCVGSKNHLVEISVGRQGWRGRYGKPIEIDENIFFVPMVEMADRLEGGDLRPGVGGLVSWYPLQRYPYDTHNSLVGVIEMERRDEFPKGQTSETVMVMRVVVSSAKKPCRSIGVEATTRASQLTRTSYVTMYYSRDLLGTRLKLGFKQIGENHLNGLAEIQIRY